MTQGCNYRGRKMQFCARMRIGRAAVSLTLRGKSTADSPCRSRYDPPGRSVPTRSANERDVRQHVHESRAAHSRSATPACRVGIIDRLEIIRDDRSATRSSRPRIVIIGAGFGGLSAAMQLARVAADVTVIDRRNHHLFQPLLYQVATAALSPADIAAPIRGILSRQANADVTLGTVTGSDTVGRTVLIGARRIPYDQLIIATGARDSCF